MANKVGRPSFEATDERRRTVRAMAAYGVPHLDIAHVLGCGVTTLRAHFWRELDTAAIEANAKVAETLFKRATEGTGKEAVTAAIFWLKCRAGWRDGHVPLAQREERAEAARTAGQNSEWGDDLAPLTGAIIN